MRLEHIADDRWRAIAPYGAVTFTRDDPGPLFALMAATEKAAKRDAPDPLGLRATETDRAVADYLARGGTITRSTHNPIARPKPTRQLSHLSLDDLEIEI